MEHQQPRDCERGTKLLVTNYLLQFGKIIPHGSIKDLSEIVGQALEQLTIPSYLQVRIWGAAQEANGTMRIVASFVKEDDVRRSAYILLPGNGHRLSPKFLDEFVASIFTFVPDDDGSCKTQIRLNALCSPASLRAMTSDYSALMYESAERLIFENEQGAKPSQIFHDLIERETGSKTILALSTNSSWWLFDWHYEKEDIAAEATPRVIRFLERSDYKLNVTEKRGSRLPSKQELTEATAQGKCLIELCSHFPREKYADIWKNDWEVHVYVTDGNDPSELKGSVFELFQQIDHRLRVRIVDEQRRYVVLPSLGSRFILSPRDASLLLSLSLKEGRGSSGPQVTWGDLPFEPALRIKEINIDDTDSTIQRVTLTKNLVDIKKRGFFGTQLFAAIETDLANRSLAEGDLVFESVQMGVTLNSRSERIVLVKHSKGVHICELNLAESHALVFPDFWKVQHFFAVERD